MSAQVLQVPLDDLLHSKSPTLISLATLWINILLQKVVKTKPWSWAYALHILNNEAANVTFDELFSESIQSSQSDIAALAFSSVLQNESLQDELSNFLKTIAQKCLREGTLQLLHKLSNFNLTASSDVLDSSQLKFEFESLMKGSYERVVQVYTAPENPGDPPHLTACLTFSNDVSDMTGTTAYLKNDKKTKGIPSTDAMPYNLTPTMNTGATPHHFTQTPDTLVQSETSETCTIREECEEAQLYFQELASKGRSIRILVTGQIQQGKSKLVNSLIGKRMAKEGDEVPGPHSMTHNIESYTEKINGVQVTLVDMPGFSNLNGSDQNINFEIGHNISEEPIDLILFCVRMDRQLERKDYEMMQNLTQMFGQSVWEHTVFVLTFANKLKGNPTKFAQKQAEWNKMLHKYAHLEGGISADRVEQIPVLVAGNEEENLPGYGSWFSQFWVTAFKCTKDNSKEDQCQSLDYSSDSSSDCEDECSNKESSKFTRSQRDKYCEEEMINGKTKKEGRSLQEQGISFHSEMVSVAGMVDFTCEYRNSLVTGHTQHNNKVWGVYQTRDIPFTKTSSNSTSDVVTDIISSSTTETLLCVSADPSLYSQLKTPTAELTTHKQVSQSSSASPRLLVADSEKEMTAKQACIEKAVNCLYYSQMLKGLTSGNVKFSLQAEVVMATQFATTLACNKLEYSEVARHLVSLKIVTASAQTCGSETTAHDFISKKLAAQHNKPTMLSVNLSRPPPHTGEQLVSSTEQKALLDSCALETFTCSLHVNLLVQKNVEQTKSLSDAFLVLDSEELSSTDIICLFRLLGENFIQHHLLCQELSGHTLLHPAIETKNATTGVVMRFATHKMVLNPENLPFIVLLFENKLWSITRTIKNQITSCGAMLQQDIIFQIILKIGGNSLFPYLFGLQGHYSPDLDQNLNQSRSNPTNILSLCNGSSTPLSAMDTSSESFPEGDMTSLELADDSDSSGGKLPIAKRPTRQSHSTVLKHKTYVAVKQKKSLVAVLHQYSGYSSDESDHTNDRSHKKSSKFTIAQRAAGIKRRELYYKDSNSESEAETEDFSAQIWDTEDTLHGCDTDKEPVLSIPCDIQLILQGTSCTLQISNFTDCSFNSSTSDSRVSTELHHADLRVSTELHHAVKHQCFQSVRNILACDGGEDQIYMMDEDGQTSLEIASQSKEFKMFKFLLEGLVRSQVSPSVILQQCSSHRLITLLASVVKVLSKLEIDIDSSTLHWAMVSCQHWEIPSVVHVTSTTVPTVVLPLWSNSEQLLMCRGGSRKKVTKELSAKQEQEIPCWSEMVSVAHRPNRKSLVVDLSLTQNEWELNEPTVTTSTAPTFTDSLYQKCSQQPFHETAGTFTSPQIMTNSSLIESSTPELVTDECVPEQESLSIWHACIENATNCLDAGYYSQVLILLKFGKVPSSLPANIVMATQFGCALAYYKLGKFSEAAKQFENLKAIAASTQSSGNESIASVYLGDIEFTESRYTEAIEHYSHALKQHKDDMYNLGKEYQLIVPTFSAISVKLGSAFRNASKVKDAMHAYRQAIATSNSKKDNLLAHMSLGNLLQSMGDNANALEEYKLSIELSEELKDYVSLSLANGNMGIAYLGLYRRDKVLYHLEKALDLTVEHEPTPQAIGRAYNNLGTAYQALNKLDKAEEYYNLALSQAIYSNDLPEQDRAHSNIANVLMLKKDYERAIRQYTEAVHLSRDRSTFFTALCSRGCSYYEWAESKKASLPHKIGSCVDGSDFAIEYCEVEHHQPSFEFLSNSILKYYQLGRQDLEQVVEYCEETFENIKGSSKDLRLSVCPFETNSRTFYCLQNCLVNLGECEKALVVAEQSRTRTLGEVLVKKGSTISHPLAAPLNLQNITYIVQSQHSVVVYLSYTGATLLGWVLAPKSDDKLSVDMFEVPLEDHQCQEKSFDYNLRYGLTDELVERNFEPSSVVDYKSNEPVRKLYRLIGKPLVEVLKGQKNPHSTSGVHKILIIPDNYTTIPFSCLLDEEDKFLGDNHSFRIMPSLLTMGIVNQFPSVVVQMPADSQKMCVVGNPTIPSFTYNGDKWSLRKLPFATQQAECVANILKTVPILHKLATKDAVLMRIMSAKVVHIATHCSASAGFLAFSGEDSFRNEEVLEANNILLHPEDIQKLSISPALVVFNNCDRGRTVKANRILDLVQAFIVAGAQAVLTTLWSVPDESASVFMPFFYQYLMNGLKASLALHKATLSLRCFSKYSQYVHWGGYELTGKFTICKHKPTVQVYFIVLSPILFLSQEERSNLTLQSPAL